MSGRKRVTIFEGCDGSGKTTAAKAFAAQTGALYLHFGNLPQVGAGLPRIYLEAMLPALLGYQDVVMDRSWLSEPIYGQVYRDGADRIGPLYKRMLERVALSCGALVVKADPGEAVCLANWRARREDQNKDWEHDEGVRDVHKAYARLDSALGIVSYDYTNSYDDGLLGEFLDTFRPEQHSTDEATAGSWYAKVCLVGEGFAEPKDRDCYWQYPFVSFSNQGCSAWLTDHLDLAGISERELLWANADMIEPGGEHNANNVEHLIALGNVAHERLQKLGYKHHTVAHPQHHKRFHSSEPYELITLLKELGYGN